TVREEVDHMGTIERLHDIVAPICVDLGLDLIDLEYRGAVVRVSVDKEGGVDIDAIAKATRAISRAFDEHDPLTSRYTLEVSSPGLERPLRTPAHFQRAIATKVRIKTRPGVEGERRVEGVLSTADDDTVT